MEQTKSSVIMTLLFKWNFPCLPAKRGGSGSGTLTIDSLYFLTLILSLI